MALICLGLDVTFFTNHGNQKHYSGDYQEAIADYSKAIRLTGGTDVWLIYNRANSKKLFGLYQAAIENYNLATILEPSHVCFFITVVRSNVF